MGGSITQVQSHDEGKDGRSVTRVHGSVTGVQTKSVTESMENEWVRNCSEVIASRFTRTYGVFLGMGMYLQTK